MLSNKTEDALSNLEKVSATIATPQTIYANVLFAIIINWHLGFFLTKLLLIPKYRDIQIPIHMVSLNSETIGNLDFVHLDYRNTPLCDANFTISIQKK